MRYFGERVFSGVEWVSRDIGRLGDERVITVIEYRRGAGQSAWRRPQLTERVFVKEEREEEEKRMEGSRRRREEGSDHQQVERFWSRIGFVAGVFTII